MTKREVLVAARAAVQRGWCRRALGRDADGHSVLDVRTASSVCVVGAITLGIQGAQVSWNDVVTAVRHAIGPDADRLGLAGWNDAINRTQAEVLAVFDRAIEAQS